MNEYINLTVDNIDKEHICCALSDKKHQEGVNLKKEWIKERIKEGHVFRKLNVNGKVFIEYDLLSNSWVPIIGDNYIYIYCLWVAGSYKGHGYGQELLDYVIKEAKDKCLGICTISSKKKKPFISEKEFFIKNGFKVVDNIGDYELLALDLNNKLPKFSENARKMEIDNKELTIYYSLECPFTTNSVKELEEYSKEKSIKINFIKIDSLEKAKNMPCIFNNWAMFKDGKFISNTLQNKTTIEKLV